MTDIIIQRNPHLTNQQLNALFSGAWQSHETRDFEGTFRHSLLWIGAFQKAELVGFLNLAWDGGVHGFILDPTVRRDLQRKGIGLRLLREAIGAAKEHNLEWLHVDFVAELEPLYRAVGFRPTAAGVMRLR